MRNEVAALSFLIQKISCRFRSLLTSIPTYVDLTILYTTREKNEYNKDIHEYVKIIKKMCQNLFNILNKI